MPLSLVGSIFHEPTISYASTSALLDEAGIHPSFMRTIPSDFGTAAAFRDWCHYNKWTNVGIIAPDDERVFGANDRRARWGGVATTPRHGGA